MGSGSTVLLWEDLWCPVILAQAFPSLFHFAANANASVNDVINAPDLVTIFNLPLSEQAHEEFLAMQNLISQIPYNENLKDGWVFHWGNGSYSSQKVYELAFEGLEVPRTIQWIWKSKCIPRIKFFAWLLMVDRLNTKAMLRRHHYNTQAGLFCVLCRHTTEEDIEHLFFSCPFATNC